MDKQNLESFLGINFGTSMNLVKEIMVEKPGCIIDIDNSNNEQLFFDNVKFAGHETLFISFKFIDDKFHTANVLIKPKLESQIVELYNNIKDEINEKYYKTTADYETYKAPYEKDDGYTETAITLGKALFSAYWNFKNSNTNNNIDNYITLEVHEKLLIKITYQDGILIDLVMERQKAKNQSDY